MLAGNWASLSSRCENGRQNDGSPLYGWGGPCESIKTSLNASSGRRRFLHCQSARDDCRENCHSFETRQGGADLSRIDVEGPLPGHDDQHASLDVTETTDGGGLFSCRVGCSQTALIDALREREAGQRVNTRQDQGPRNARDFHPPRLARHLVN
jgi:hypothetical protein